MPCSTAVILTMFSTSINATHKWAQTWDSGKTFKQQCSSGMACAGNSSLDPIRSSLWISPSNPNVIVNSPPLCMRKNKTFSYAFHYCQHTLLPSNISAIVMGNVLHIHCICSHSNNIQTYLYHFYECSINQGHFDDNLCPLFGKTFTNAWCTSCEHKMSTNTLNWKMRGILRKESTFTSASTLRTPPLELQRLRNTIVAEPEGQRPLASMQNYNWVAVKISPLVLSSSCHLNISNCFSVWDIRGRQQNILSFLKDL